MAEFEELCTQKIKIVEERDELVNQTEEERLRLVNCWDFLIWFFEQHWDLEEPKKVILVIMNGVYVM